MKKNKTKLIIFDCYGLVLNEGYPNTARALVKKFGGSYQKYIDIMYKKFFNMAATRKISQKKAWQKTVEYFNLPLSWSELRDLHYSLIKMDKRVPPLIKNLENKGYKVLLLSKNTRSQFTYAVQKFNLKKIFQNMINTWELNLPKASKKTLRVVMKKFKVRAEEIVYADDQENNLIDARQMGAKTILVKNFRQFKKDLNKLLKND